ncbi:MAG: hypothetical protein KC621_26870, partial [Myxococcales bacterium]|nr:hypothetical protein [Myxococcales bacterium]
DQDCDGIVDDTIDVDGDGLDEPTELALQTDPNDPDTDGDGLDDDVEVYGVTDPLDPDTDGGGLLDGLEVDGKDPLDPDDDDLVLYGPAPGGRGPNHWAVVGAPPNAPVTLMVTRSLRTLGWIESDCANTAGVVATGVTDAQGRVVLNGMLRGGGGNRFMQVRVDLPTCLYSTVTTTTLP